MKITLRVATVFAAAGFLMPGLLMAAGAISKSLGHSGPLPFFLVYLCPSAILGLGLDNSSPGGLTMGVLVIAAINALVYATLGIAVGLFMHVRNSD